MSRRNSNASRQNRLFEFYLKELQNPEEAAVRAGFERKRVAELMHAEASAQARVSHSSEEEAARLHDMALQGLRRLALGSSAEAIGMLCQEEFPTAQELAACNLYAVSEIKCPKGGGVELKFYNRIDALRALLDYTRDARESAGGGRSLYQALANSARTAFQTSGSGYDGAYGEGAELHGDAP